MYFIFCPKTKYKKKWETLFGNPTFKILYRTVVIYNVKQCKNTLDVLRSSCMMGSYDAATLRDSFAKSLSHQNKHAELQELWQTAIDNIKGNADLSVVDSVFQPGETITPLASPTQEFALVNYFVING